MLKYARKFTGRRAKSVILSEAFRGGGKYFFKQLKQFLRKGKDDLGKKL